MGRIKSVAVKNVAKEIMKGKEDDFSDKFDKNKKAVDKAKDIDSKKIRNVVAGYITKEMKRKKKAGE